MAYRGRLDVPLDFRVASVYGAVPGWQWIEKGREAIAGLGRSVSGAAGKGAARALSSETLAGAATAALGGAAQVVPEEAAAAGAGAGAAEAAAGGAIRTAGEEAAKKSLMRRFGGATGRFLGRSLGFGLRRLAFPLLAGYGLSEIYRRAFAPENLSAPEVFWERVLKMGDLHQAPAQKVDELEKYALYAAPMPDYRRNSWIVSAIKKAGIKGVIVDKDGKLMLDRDSPAEGTFDKLRAIAEDPAVQAAVTIVQTAVPDPEKGMELARRAAKAAWGMKKMYRGMNSENRRSFVAAIAMQHGLQPPEEGGEDAFFATVATQSVIGEKTQDRAAVDMYVQAIRDWGERAKKTLMHLANQDVDSLTRNFLMSEAERAKLYADYVATVYGSGGGGDMSTYAEEYAKRKAYLDASMDALQRLQAQE